MPRCVRARETPEILSHAGRTPVAQFATWPLARWPPLPATYSGHRPPLLPTPLLPPPLVPRTGPLPPLSRPAPAVACCAPSEAPPRFLRDRPRPRFAVPDQLGANPPSLLQAPHGHRLTQRTISTAAF